MSVLRLLRRVTGPESAQEVAEAPRDVPTAERATDAVWCAAWPGGVPGECRERGGGVRELDARDPEAQAIVLRELCRDMREVLGWLGWGLLLLAIIGVLNAVDDATGGRWFQCGINVVATGFMGWAWADAVKRRSKYRMGGKR